MSRELSGTRKRAVALARAVVLGQHSQAEQLARRVLQAEIDAAERRAADAQRQIDIMKARRDASTS